MKIITSKFELTSFDIEKLDEDEKQYYIKNQWGCVQDVGDEYLVTKSEEFNRGENWSGEEYITELIVITPEEAKLLKRAKEILTFEDGIVRLK